MPYMHDIATRISVPFQDISDNGARRLDVRDGEKAVVIFILLLGSSRFSKPGNRGPDQVRGDLRKKTYRIDNHKNAVLWRGFGGLNAKE